MGCIKEYKNNDCYKQEFIYEKGKLHVRYLFVIAAILAIIGISLSLGSDTNFSAQVSMASTISSIILSAIAIFMSISGETKSSYIQNQMIETSAKLSHTAMQLEEITNEVSETIDVRLKELIIIKEDLKDLKGSIDIVRDKVDSFSSFNSVSPESIDKLSDDEFIKIYKIIYSSNESRKQPIEEMLEFVLTILDKSDSKKGISAEETLRYMTEIRKTSTDSNMLKYLWGTVLVFSMLGINRKRDIEYFHKILIYLFKATYFSVSKKGGVAQLAQASCVAPPFLSLKIQKTGSEEPVIHGIIKL